VIQYTTAPASDTIANPVAISSGSRHPAAYAPPAHAGDKSAA
jgi:hypothetical protein